MSVASESFLLFGAIGISGANIASPSSFSRPDGVVVVFIVAARAGGEGIRRISRSMPQNGATCLRVRALFYFRLIPPRYSGLGKQYFPFRGIHRGQASTS